VWYGAADNRGHKALDGFGIVAVPQGGYVLAGVSVGI
jgi:hypothetical protein